MRIIDNNGNNKNIQMRKVQMHLEGNMSFIIINNNKKGFVLMLNMFIFLLILDDGNYKNNQKCLKKMSKCT